MLKVVSLFLLISLSLTALNKWEPTNAPELQFAAVDSLGENAQWHPDFNKFFWIDIFGHKVSSIDVETRKREDYTLKDENVTAMACKKGGFVAFFFNKGFGTIDIPSGKETFFLGGENIPVPGPKVRGNDGNVDPKGRFIAGEYDEANTGLGRVMRLNDDKTYSVLVDKIQGFNGPVWSLDKKTFYYVDTANPPIKAVEYDVETGKMGKSRNVLDSSDEIGGGFDGATIDSDGYLWWAIFGGSKIVRIDPAKGEVERYIDLSNLNVKNITSVSFGGPGYRYLLATTAGFHSGQNNDGGIVLIEFTEKEGIHGVKPDFWNEGQKDELIMRSKRMLNKSEQSTIVQ